MLAKMFYKISSEGKEGWRGEGSVGDSPSCLSELRSLAKRFKEVGRKRKKLAGEKKV